MRHVNTHVTRPRTSLFVLKISGFHVKLGTRNRVHSPADSLGRYTPRAYAPKEPCLTPHHPMRVSLPAAPFTAASMSKINAPRNAFLETGRIIALPPLKSNQKSFLKLRALTTAHATMDSGNWLNFFVSNQR